MAAHSQLAAEHPAPHLFWIEHLSSFGSSTVTGVVQQFTYVVHAGFASPLHGTAAGSVDSLSVARVNLLLKSALFPELRTQLLPIAYVWVGNCRPYGRSRLQPPNLRMLNVTRLGSPTASRQRSPRRTVRASFPRIRLEHSTKRFADAGLVELDKPFVDVAPDSPHRRGEGR